MRLKRKKRVIGHQRERTMRALKYALRRIMRLKRKGFSEELGRSASVSLSAHLWDLWQRMERPLIALHYAMRSEVSLAPFIEWATDEDERVCWPRVHPDGHMDFACAHPSELTLDAKGIPAPPLDRPSVYPQMIVVPGLAFDRWGRRLGQGGGYYDQTLPRYPRALWVGVGFDIQVIPKLPSEVHDQKMDFWVTERRLQRMPIFKPRKRLGKGC